jgi:hypothetical protein
MVVEVDEKEEVKVQMLDVNRARIHKSRSELKSKRSNVCGTRLESSLTRDRQLQGC